MHAVRTAIGQVAPTDSTVLILGETGTGKELVARAIHQLSSRRDRLLVAVNCAALAPSVIASELFGHEAGAFTGATRRRIGRFELAQRGTLFLDEIAELTPEMQVMLLRVLQERTDRARRRADADPGRCSADRGNASGFAAGGPRGRFCADLFYRLNVFPIQVPPLRERPEDIGDLVRHFIHHFNRRLGKRIGGIAPESLRLLCGYGWPGNVRELENLIERAMIVGTGDVLHIDPSWLPAALPPDDPSPAASLRDVERRSIVDALRRSHDRIYGPHGAAALLGIKPTTLYGKMRRLGIAQTPDAQRAGVISTIDRHRGIGRHSRRCTYRIRGYGTIMRTVRRMLSLAVGISTHEGRFFRWRSSFASRAAIASTPIAWWSVRWSVSTRTRTCSTSIRPSALIARHVCRNARWRRSSTRARSPRRGRTARR